jgi:hypothetical protein
MRTNPTKIIELDITLFPSKNQWAKTDLTINLRTYAVRREIAGNRGGHPPAPFSGLFSSNAKLPTL